MDPATKPSVLFIYFTYTNQTRKVIDAMAEVLRGRGCDVTLAAVELIDPRYAARFQEFPMPHPYREVLGMLQAEMPRQTGPDQDPRRRHRTGLRPGVHRQARLVALHRHPDPLLSGVRRRHQSPQRQTLHHGGRVFCRRYWKHNLKTVRRLGTWAGGNFADGIHFRYLGGQIRSLLSLVSYLGSGEYRQRYLGVEIPPQPPGSAPGGGAEIRRRIGEPPGGQRAGAVGRHMNVAAVLPLVLVMRRAQDYLRGIFRDQPQMAGQPRRIPLGAAISVTAFFNDNHGRVLHRHHREQPRELASGFRTSSRAGGWCADEPRRRRSWGQRRCRRYPQRARASPQSLADDRTVLASERSLLAWWTAFGAYALSLGFGGLLPSLSKISPTLGEFYAVLGVSGWDGTIYVTDNSALVPDPGERETTSALRRRASAAGER